MGSRRKKFTGSTKRKNNSTLRGQTTTPSPTTMSQTRSSSNHDGTATLGHLSDAASTTSTTTTSTAPPPPPPPGSKAALAKKADDDAKAEKKLREDILKASAQYENARKMAEKRSLSPRDQGIMTSFFNEKYDTTPNEKAEPPVNEETASEVEVKTVLKPQGSVRAPDKQGAYENVIRPTGIGQVPERGNSIGVIKQIFVPDGAVFNALNNHVLEDPDGEFKRQGLTEVVTTEDRKPRRIPNSEIIYQQWIRAKELGHLPAEEPFRYLRRSRISGLVGERRFKEIKDAYADANPGANMEGVVFKPANQWFNALLTLPNTKSAIFLLQDHGKDLGITGISEIVVEPGGKILVRFTREGDDPEPIPAGQRQAGGGREASAPATGSGSSKPSSPVVRHPLLVRQERARERDTQGKGKAEADDGGEGDGSA